MLDIELINKFREVINDKGFTCFRYRKKDNKNQWNCICSAMDWITVAVEHLSGYPEKRASELGSMEIYAYIASVDIIVEAVQQLHRVIFSTRDRIFDKETDCFPGNIFHQDDHTYFKTIRACFGAHPVNLDDPGMEKDKERHRFASWSGKSFEDSDFSVILYSNQIENFDIILNIDMGQVLAFAQKYYDHLNDLMVELKRQYTEFCEKMRATQINCPGNVLSRLYELRRESKKRLNNVYYGTTIDELIVIFETSISCEANRRLVDAYRAALEPLIDEIHQNLQDMKLSDLENDHLIHPTSDILSDEWGYWTNKLFERTRMSDEQGKNEMLNAEKNRIEEIYRGLFTPSYTDDNELRVLVMSSIYQLSLENK